CSGSASLSMSAVRARSPPSAAPCLVTGEESRVDADVVVCATGYLQADGLGLLGEVAGMCHRDDEGRVRVERDYRVVTDTELRCGVYLQGGTEHTHGITSSLLSNTAVRVGEILHSILERGLKAAPDTVRPVAGGAGGGVRQPTR
ncbi:hypothetical protein ACWDA9_28355, partial [Streptomyces sp. NPDC001193]